MRLGPRRWIAWKLVQLASRIYQAEYEQTITVTPPQGHEIEIHVIGDLYGCGISSTSGIRWHVDGDDARIMTAEMQGWLFRWEDEE